MLLELILIVGAILYLYKYYAALKKLPPGPFPLPFLGNIHQIDAQQPQRTIAQWGKKYGGMYTAVIGHRMIVLTDIHIIREALVQNADAFAGRPNYLSLTLFSRGNNGIVSRLTNLFNTFKCLLVMVNCGKRIAVLHCTHCAILVLAAI
jgi:hypothetical protein